MKARSNCFFQEKEKRLLMIAASLMMFWFTDKTGLSLKRVRSISKKWWIVLKRMTLFLQLVLPRMSKTAKFIVNGDITQIDLPRNQQSGLLQAIKLLTSIKGIDFIFLDSRDVVRHRLVKEIIEAYERK